MKITFNNRNINKIIQSAQLALVDTAESIKTDLIQSNTMPFATGNLQNNSTYTDEGNRTALRNSVRIVSDTVYSRKVYFDPEINIHKDKNPNAKQYWFEDYITGNKKQLPIQYFKKHLKRRLGQ